MIAPIFLSPTASVKLCTSVQDFCCRLCSAFSRKDSALKPGRGFRLKAGLRRLEQKPCDCARDTYRLGPRCGTNYCSNCLARLILSRLEIGPLAVYIQKKMAENSAILGGGHNNPYYDLDIYNYLRPGRHPQSFVTFCFIIFPGLNLTTVRSGI